MTAVVVTLDLVDEAPADDTWKVHGLCRQADPEVFFPERGNSAREAKRICGECEVRPQCLAWALARHEAFGVWGGLTERERRDLRRARPLRQAS